MINLFALRSLALISVAIYFTVDFLDRKRVRDEREELIRLKSLELAHKATLATLTGVSAAYLFYPWIQPLSIILILILAALYTEILGKIYFRFKL